MMKRPKQVHPLSDSELTEIQQVISTHPKPRVRVRAIMIRMSHEGLSAPEIATLLGVSRQTVLYQIQRYEDSGIIGIEDRPRSGAPAKANTEYIAKLQAVTMWGALKRVEPIKKISMRKERRSPLPMK